MNTRLIALLSAGPFMSRTRHYVGVPPNLTGGADERLELGQAQFLTIESKVDGVFLTRFASDGQCAGDTWHRTIEDAKEQAIIEFQGRLSEWQPVPDDVDDVVKFGLVRIQRLLE